MPGATVRHSGARRSERPRLLRALLFDQHRQALVLVWLQLGQRCTDRAGVEAGDARAGLDDADRIALAAVADLQIRQEEVIDQLADGFMILTGDGLMKSMAVFGMKLNTAEEYTGTPSAL